MRSTSTSAILFAPVIIATGCGDGGGGEPPTMPPPAATVPQITVQQAFTQLPDFTNPVALMQAPGDSNRWFVPEKRGRILVFANNPASSATSLFLDITDRVNASGEGGLLGLAFHPDFPMTPEVFVSYTRSGSGTPLVSHVSRFFSTDNGQTINPNVEEVILSLPQEQANHNGGNVHFGPDGLLYVGFGDSGGSGDPRGYAQDTSNLHGTIVRVDVEGGAPYAIPAGNPFETNAVCVDGFGIAPCPEIFAWGLRNPWRFSFDAVTGTLWAGDVGQGDWEEIDVIEAGSNYGWNAREGAHCYPPGTSCDTAGFTDPVTEYDHSAGSSVTGGYVYRGAAIPDLVGWYLFGDFVSGRLFAIPGDSRPGVEPETLAETGLNIVSFAEDTDGELYVVDFVGTIHEVQAAP